MQGVVSRGNTTNLPKRMDNKVGMLKSRLQQARINAQNEGCDTQKIGNRGKYLRIKALKQGGKGAKPGSKSFTTDGKKIKKRVPNPLSKIKSRRS